jgi:hypothetical protein
VYCTRFVIRPYGGGVLLEDGREISRRAGEMQAVQGGDPHCTLTALCSLGS